MHFTKTTARAFAASVAIVVAGATVAGAAVFHLPILGFGRAGVASASVAPATRRVVAPKVRPRVVVKTRYVDEIVHRRAPVTVVPPGPSPAAAGSPASAQLDVASSPVPPPAPAYAPPATQPAVQGSAGWHDDGEHAAPASPAGGSGGAEVDN